MPVPIVVAPSLNVTLPVGVPTPGVATVSVADKVTVWPAVAGFGEPVGVLVAVAALVTVCVTGVVAVLPAYVLFPA